MREEKNQFKKNRNGTGEIIIIRAQIAKRYTKIEIS